MEYMLAVFKARSETLNFYSNLRRSGVPAQVVSTPKEISAVCGISIKFFPSELSRVRENFILRRYNSFNGFYKVEDLGTRLIITRA